MDAASIGGALRPGRHRRLAQSSQAVRIEQPARRLLDGPHHEAADRLFEICHAGPAELGGQARDGPRRRVAQLANAQKDAALVRVQLEPQALLVDLLSGTKELQARALVAQRHVHVVARRDADSCGHRRSTQDARAVVARPGHRVDGFADPARRRRVPVVVHDQRALAADRFEYAKTSSSTDPSSRDEVVQQEVVDLGEQRPPVQQRHDLALVALHEPRIGLLVPVGAPVLHAVFLGVALDLAVPEHRQARAASP